MAPIVNFFASPAGKPAAAVASPKAMEPPTKKIARTNSLFQHRDFRLALDAILVKKRRLNETHEDDTSVTCSMTCDEETDFRPARPSLALPAQKPVATYVRRTQQRSELDTVHHRPQSFRRDLDYVEHTSRYIVHDLDENHHVRRVVVARSGSSSSASSALSSC